MNNPYILQPTKVLKNEVLNEKVRLLTLDYAFHKFTPGQFYMVSLLGYGESPFGIMQTVNEKSNLQLLVRNVGELSEKISQLKKDDKIFVRGPLGHGFPVREWYEKNITMIAGGTGIVPIKAMLDYIYLHQDFFGEIQLMYGANNSKELFFQSEFRRYKKFAEILYAAEKHPTNWEGNDGLVTSLISKKTLNIENTILVLCGPPIMYQKVIEKVLDLGFTKKNIYLSLERRMRCGIGKCQHCTCGQKYVCLDGPVFRYDEVLKMPDGDL